MFPDLVVFKVVVKLNYLAQGSSGLVTDRDVAQLKTQLRKSDSYNMIKPTKKKPLTQKQLTQKY